MPGIKLNLGKRAPLACWLQNYLSLRSTLFVSYPSLLLWTPRWEYKAKALLVVAGEGWKQDRTTSFAFSFLYVWLSGISSYSPTWIEGLKSRAFACTEFSAQWSLYWQALLQLNSCLSMSRPVRRWHPEGRLQPYPASELIHCCF